MALKSSSASNVIQNFDEYTTEVINTPNHQATYEFTPKLQKSTKNNAFSGIRFLAWMEILRKRWRQIEYLRYWPRILMITLLSIFNSFLGMIEYFLFESTIRSTKPHPRPVFILGHPRTGTTLLHSLVALDEERFDFCSTFCAGFPSCFLWFERIGKFLFRGILDETRPMDNVKLDFDLPQEDELATNVLSAGTSPYMPLWFPHQESEFRPFYGFDDETKNPDEALPRPLMAKARQQWIRAFYYLCQKLTVKTMRNNGGAKRRLVLKSPVHTARIPLLLRLFPDAQFVYIHRHPYDVFRSAAHMADTTYWYTYMNTPSNDDTLEFILRQYEILWDRYEEGRQLLNQNQLVEVSFDELSNDPVQALDKIYKQLGWNISSKLKEKLETVTQKDVKKYKKNAHKELDPRMKATIQSRWGSSFDRLGYER